MTTEEKKLVTKQIVSVQNELAKLQNLLQDEGEEPYESDKFECIAVTQVDVFPFQGGVNLGHMKGLARVVLNDQLVIRGLRIMEGINGLFVSYPLDPFYKGEDFRSIVNPITRQLREHIENCILEKYQAAIA
jgi:stage V sporulation protein G